MKILRYLATAAALGCGFTAFDAPAQREPTPIENVVSQLNLDPDRAQKVTTILQNSRSRARAAREQIGRPTDETSRNTLRSALDAIRTDTNEQLAAILSPDEMSKLKAAMPPPRMGGKRGHH
jgi:hypothetical protein